MTKITFIGAGSYEFTRELIKDIFTFPLLEGCTISLMDIEPERLEFARLSVEKIRSLVDFKFDLEVTMDRQVALKNADVVICSILSGDVNVWRFDVEIPKKYGVDINVGDTRGPAGIFRALRTIPVMLSIVSDMEKYCPDALLLNYSNPMSILCRAIQKSSSINLTGLCHSVQGTAMMLANWIDAPFNEVSYTCAGINHQAWYLEFKWNNQDAYPLIKKALEDPLIYKMEIVRNEMFKHLDYYVTESSGHVSEYNWWFRKRQELIDRYCLPGIGWNPGEYAYILKEYEKRKLTWKDDARNWLSKEKPISIERGLEYAAYIINAWMGGDPFGFNGNVPNDYLITNLPNGACVEVPVYVERGKIRPTSVGALPPQCVALNHINVMSEEMAVEAALKGDSHMLFHAVAYDPLTAAVLSLDEIQKMVTEMLEKNKEFLPHFNI